MLIDATHSLALEKAPSRKKDPDDSMQGKIVWSKGEQRQQEILLELLQKVENISEHLCIAMQKQQLLI